MHVDSLTVAVASMLQKRRLVRSRMLGSRRVNRQVMVPYGVLPTMGGVDVTRMRAVVTRVTVVTPGKGGSDQYRQGQNCGADAANDFESRIHDSSSY